MGLVSLLLNCCMYDMYKLLRLSNSLRVACAQDGLKFKAAMFFDNDID